MTEQEQTDLIERFCKDAVRVMEGAVNNLPDVEQRKLLTSAFTGGEFEVRVRLRANRAPRISVALIDQAGEWLVAPAGGAS